MRWRVTILAMLACGAVIADDDTLNWLIKEHATTRPTSAPALKEVAPASRPAPKDSVTGTLTLSDGTRVKGPISTTPQKPLRIWIEGEHRYVDVALSELRRLTALVAWERDEKEWHFIASGSDVKEYTGRTYPARETNYTAVLRDGRQVVGGVVAPLYVHGGGEPSLFVLHKRDKGPMGSTLADLKYVTSVEFSDDSTP